MRYQLIHFLLFTVFIVSFSYGQQRRFGHYGLPEGLPQETILAIDNDAQGFLWFGTSDGTVRYDGTDFYVPPVDKNTGLDLSGWRVGALLVDKDIVYSGTGQKGLLAYNVITQATTAIGLPNSNCSALTMTSKGLLIGYYNQGIGLLDSFGNFKLLNFSDDFPKNSVTLVEFENHIYIGTDKGELYQFSTVDISEKKPIKLTKLNQDLKGIHRLIVVEDRLLIASDQGLLHYKNKQLSPITISKENNPEASFTVIDVAVAPSQTFVATTQGLLEGDWVSPTHFNATSHYTANIKYDPFSLNRDGINDIHIYENVLSIGHNSLDLTAVNKQQVFKSVIAQYNLGNPSVFTILETEKQLWVGTTSGLLIMDKNSSTYSLLPSLRSRSIIDDGEGNIWVGASNGILIFPQTNFNYSNPKNTILSEINANNVSITNPNIRSIYKDRGEQLWVVTYNKGIFKYNGDTSANDFTFKAFVSENNFSSIPSPFAININQDFKENYWITTQKGLSKMSLDANDNPSFKNYYEEDGLATSGVLSTYIDHSGKLWVATRKGLSEYDSNNDTFISYKKREGLSNAFVYNILEDNNNDLWLSTNGGLFLFNTLEKTFANYTPKDGVQSTEFNLGAAYKNDLGQLYFGGIAGLNKFDPDEVASLDKESSIKFTQFTSKNERIPNTNSTISELKVPFDIFPLNITFAAMDYRPSKNITYQYRLLPDNKEWNDLEDKNQVQFLSLASGAHTLEIQGKSRGSSWLQKPLTLDLTITPPWYKSTVAYLCYLLLFLGIVYAFYRISLQRQIAGQESKRLKDLDDVKSRFITNITHEFRTPLTVILGYINNLKPKFKALSEEKEDLFTIEKNSESLLGLVNQMLDLAKLEQGRLTVTYHKNDIARYAKVLLESLESYALEKDINLQFSSTLTDPILDFDEEKIRQILTNLISNAIKFTPEKGSVALSLSTKEEDYIIEVRDTGTGISEEDLPQIFDRFYQVENNSFKVSQGTGIGLALTKELTQLMQGKIWATSTINEGATFYVQLPISRQASYKEIHLEENNGLTQHIYVPKTSQTLAAEDAPLVLVVEDNKDMSRYIVSCLQETFNIETAYNGKKGVEKALSKTPDIILSDVMMPIMDGFEMTQKLQAQEATNHIPIILLTSKALQEDKIEGLESGADAYLTKPFQKKELLLRIDKLIEKRRTLQKRYQISTVLLEKKAQKDPIKDKNILFLNKAIAVIQDQIINPDFNSEMLSRELALSDSQLYRKLKAITNTSTAIFIRNVRLEKAKELLETTTKTVSEIAYDTGFNDPNWFGKVFKEKFDCSPTQLRK